MQFAHGAWLQITQLHLIPLYLWFSLNPHFTFAVVISECLHVCVCVYICVCTCRHCVHACLCVRIYLHTYMWLWVFPMCVSVSVLWGGGFAFSLGRWGSRRRCCTCLCSLRGPSLRPAAHTPHRPRPNAGSHCWRRSRNSDQHPERWRWLLPVTHRGHMHWQLEHGQNRANTHKCQRHLFHSSLCSPLQQKLSQYIL